MRRFLFFVLVLPVFSSAQINRSAREFARERIQEYIVTKLFKDLSYKPVSFGELKAHEEKNPEIAWSIEHKFGITEIQVVSDKRTEILKPYRFVFYLDKKMKVQRAESFWSN
jgi:hypothetical protein